MISIGELYKTDCAELIDIPKGSIVMVLSFVDDCEVTVFFNNKIMELYFDPYFGERFCDYFDLVGE